MNIQEINWNTIRMYELIKELAKSSKHGILPFSTAPMNSKAVLYDDREPKVHHPELDGFPVVSTYTSDDRAIIHTYDDEFPHTTIRVYLDDETPYIQIEDTDSGAVVYIEHGDWDIDCD